MSEVRGLDTSTPEILMQLKRGQIQIRSALSLAELRFVFPDSAVIPRNASRKDLGKVHSLELPETCSVQKGSQQL